MSAPTVLLVCVHNAGRSQMAAGFLRHLAGDRVAVRSAGSEPKDAINPVAVAAMAEVGIDIAGGTPTLLTVDDVRESDVVITMGCGDACPIFPGKRYEDWPLDDPAGQGIEAVRPIRDAIRARVERLLAELLAATVSAGRSVPTTPLPEASPSDAGVDALGVLNLIDALERAPAQDPHALAVLRGGRVIARGAWAPYTVDRPVLSYSLSKSFTSAAAGVLVDDGVLDLDAPVVEFFPEWADEIPDASGEPIRVRHALSMATGDTRERLLDAWLADPDEPVRGFLRTPPPQPPGSVFAYNQPATYTAAAIVQRLAGQSLTALLAERVLGPIGAGPIRWQQWPAGRDLGFSGGFFTIDHAARLGQLLLQRGAWGERRVLSSDWVEAATSVQIPTALDASSTGDWAHGYGFQHWVMPDGFRGDGAYGQYALVFPALDLVVAYQGQTLELQETIDLVRQHLLPAVGRAGAVRDDEQLAERMLGLELPALSVAASASASALLDPAEWHGRRFTVAGGADAARVYAVEAARAERPSDAPPFAEVEVRADGSGWVLVIPDPAVAGGELVVPFGEHGWTVTEAATAAGGTVSVAVSGGFADAETLRLDLVALDTPHRAHLELRRVVEGDPEASTGLLSATWQTPPLSLPCTPGIGFGPLLPGPLPRA